MVLGSNHVTNDTLNLFGVDCCEVVSTLRFRSPWRVLRAWPWKVLWLSKKKKRGCFPTSFSFLNNYMTVLCLEFIWNLNLSFLMNLWMLDISFSELPFSKHFKKFCQEFCLLYCQLQYYCIAYQVSPDGKQFSITSPDRRIRIFWFKTGKLRRVYDESLEVIFFSTWLFI